MKIFVYEHLCASAAADAGKPDSLRIEGWAMLSDVLEDLERVPGIELVTILPSAGEDLRLRGVSVERDPSAFRELARAADYTLVIAPEFDDILLNLCQAVEHAGGRLLGPSPAAIRLTSDKFALGERLAKAGIPTPPSRLYPCALPAGRETERFVVKPRFGAGSQATFTVTDPEDLEQGATQAAREGWKGELLVQPYVPGQPASVAFLVGARQNLALVPAAQVLSVDGRFHYQGGYIPLPADLSARAIGIARQAVDLVPGLKGFVGVDLVLGDAADGTHDCVIEINPRFTTSYVGLRALACTNLAHAMLRVAIGEEIAPPQWRTGVVHFQPNGEVAVQEA